MSIRFEYTKRLSPEYTQEELRTVAILLEKSLVRVINEGRDHGGFTGDDPLRRRVREVLAEGLGARVFEQEPVGSVDNIIKDTLIQRIREAIDDSENEAVQLLVEAAEPLEGSVRYQAIDLLRESLSAEENMVIGRLVDRLRGTGTGTLEPLLELAGLTSNLWPKDTEVLLVYFFSSDTQLTAKVLSIANQWHEHCRIRFEATDDIDRSDIRVSFEPGGSWSYIGKEARAARLLGQATMNFSWLTPHLPDEEFQQVVLHEFGHALGMVHEHQAAQPPIKWSTAYVLMWCGLPPNNWTPAKVKHNIFDVYGRDEVNHSGGFDMESIMVYCVPQEFTIDRIVFPPNTKLSKRDKEHIGKIYPKVNMLKS